jgi:hypothetical protein
MDSNTENIYIMDSNSFITPSRQYYQFSIAPSFWEQLSGFVEKKCIMLIRQVYMEICIQKEDEKKDELQKWVEKTFNYNFYDTYTDLDIINNYRKIMNYIQNNKEKYSYKALNAWAINKTADGWIIATAMTNVNKYAVVSFENGRESCNNPKIKTVASEFGVKYIDLFEMMNQLKFKL